MQFFYIIIGILAGVFWLLAGRKKKDDSKEDRSFLMLQNQISDINKTLDAKLSEYLKSSQGDSQMMHKHIGSFTESITKMQGNLEKVFESVKSSTEKMSSFQDIFKTPKLRGEWGESSLKYLLDQTYPVQRILKQHHFRNGEAVDFAIRLPNDLILPIDSKFPSDVYSAYVEEENENIKTQKKAVFLRRVKEEIDAISSKYIKPEEGTTDFALLYVPAEKIFYDLMFDLKEAELNEYSQKKKVIITSPNTLYLTLSVVEHWFRDMTVAKETQEIIKRLNTILIDGQKLSESFSRLGKHIDNVKSSYDDSGKRLELLSGRVKKVIAIGDGKSGETE